MRVDAVSVEVIGNAFMSAAEEMGAALIRSSISTNIKERRDCSTAIFDSDGETVVQAEHIPIHLGSMLGIVESILSKFPRSEIRPGDMFISNDPYSGGGTHLPDINVAAPVFFDGELVAFVANIAHHSDVGGKVAGSGSADTTSIFQEGIRIPPVKIVNDGHLVSDLLDLILLNCRLQEERLGDLKAQFAANQIGINRVMGIYRRFGRDKVHAATEELKAYSERKIRAAIAAIPDGVYEFEDYMDNDGTASHNVRIRVKVTVEGDRIHLDFTGSSPQVKAGINVVENALKASVFYALKALLDPTIPPNAGYYKAVTINAPKGTIVNAEAPAPVAGRTDTCQRVVDVIFGALAKAIPDKVPAASNGAVTTVMFSGVNPESGQPYVYLESLGGGSGARPNRDGEDGVHVHVTNTSNLPVEALEKEYPLRVERYELIPDSGGAGRFRGGLGVRRDICILDHECSFAAHGDRHKKAPWGLFGGLSGKTGRFVVDPGRGDERVLPSAKVSGIVLEPGDTLRIETPGAGGYGPPWERAEEALRWDVLEGKVTDVSPYKQSGEDKPCR